MAAVEVPRRQPGHRPFHGANYDAVAFIKQHHARITNLHVKDMKKATNGGGYTPCGQGDTPIKDVLQAPAEEQVGHPGEHRVRVHGDPDGTMAAMEKCFGSCKDALA